MSVEEPVFTREYYYCYYCDFRGTIDVRIRNYIYITIKSLNLFNVYLRKEKEEEKKKEKLLYRRRRVFAARGYASVRIINSGRT